MSALIGPAKAARILGEAMRLRAEQAQSPVTREVLDLMGCAHLQAAQRMEQLMREECLGREDQP